MTPQEIASWAASLISMTGVWMYGTRREWGATLGILAFIPWQVVAFTGEHILWGLVLCNTVFASLHVRNLILWRLEQ